MASLLFGVPNSFPSSTEDGSPRKKKKIPEVAVYVAGAAFAVTTGLTLLVLPYVRQAAKMSNPTQFVSNHNLPRLTAGVGRPSSSSPAASVVHNKSAESSSSRLKNSSPISSTPTSSLVQPPISTSDPSILRDKRFNDREERSLYGSTIVPDPNSEQKLEPVSPFLGFQALGIATAMVLGSAGIGAFIVAKLLGVNDMSEFGAKMRETLQTSMPVLVSSVNKPGRSIDGLDGPAIDSWVAKIQEEDEEEERPS